MPNQKAFAGASLLIAIARMRQLVWSDVRHGVAVMINITFAVTSYVRLQCLKMTGVGSSNADTCKDLRNLCRHVTKQHLLDLHKQASGE